MKLVVLSDIHLVPAGAQLYGLDPAARLARAVDVINRDHRDIAFVVIAGDLVHSGDCAAYEVLCSILERLYVPVILLMGNHDRRASFRAVFPNADDDGNGFVQSVRTLDAATLITIDTLDESATTHGGELCDKRLAFLENGLRQAPRDRPVLLFQHHPPLDLGLPHMDAFRLQDSEAEWQVFRRTRTPDIMFFGHIHRPVAGIWRGIPFHIQRATSHQVAFDLTTSAYIPGTHEWPDYSLVAVYGRDIVLLQRSFLYDGPTFSLDSKAAQPASSVDELQR
jgi:3',5'-cyclic-AMP phosphodiesterase